MKCVIEEMNITEEMTITGLVFDATFAVKHVTAAQRGIHDAVKDANVQTLEVVVRNGANINEHDTTKDHFTALHWACHVGSLEVRCSFLSA